MQSRKTLMRTFKTFAAAGGAVAILALGAAAQAQQPPAPGGQRPPMEGRQRPDPAEMRAHMAERMTAVLQLTPQQKPALDAFLAAMAPPEGARQDRRKDMAEMRGLTTPQRLDAMAARMAERQQAFARRAEATKRFYAQLTPAQQKAFDALGPMGRGMGPGMGPGKGPGMGHGGMGHGGMGPGGHGRGR